MLDFNRTSLSKEEEELLNTRLERIIILLAPYFHHQAAKQVLEWLIFRYQVMLKNKAMDSVHPPIKKF